MGSEMCIRDSFTVVTVVGLLSYRGLAVAEQIFEPNDEEFRVQNHAAVALGACVN